MSHNTSPLCQIRTSYHRGIEIHSTTETFKKQSWADQNGHILPTVPQLYLYFQGQVLAVTAPATVPAR
uniref:Uncharacterized protein n=1 Tax=Anguilla anguilla TaxID=7936 RepID=A0A0E9WH03_ANGAN